MAANDFLDFEAVFRSTPTALIVVHSDLTIAAANHCFSYILGRPPEAFVGQRLFEALPAGDEAVGQLRGALDRIFASGDSESLPVLHIPLPDGEGGTRDRFWSCTGVAVRGPHGPVASVALHAQDVTEMHARLHGGTGPARAQVAHEEEFSSSLFDRAERVQARNALLLAETGELRDLFMRAPSFMCLLRGGDYRVELANSAFLELVGRRELVGRPFREAVPEVEGQLYVDLLDKVFRSGEAFVGKQMRAEFERTPGRGPEEVFISFVFQPILGSDGAVIGIFIDGNDVTDHVRAEKAQALLVRELHHRVRNTLATVQGVMNSTARTAESIEDYQWAFSGRISSLARTHSLLTEEIQQFVSLPHLLRQEIGAYADGDSDRVLLEGPDVELPSQLAVPLGMTIHELSTNAYRHGALSVPDGRVMVSWTVMPAKEKRILTCRWIESGGPPVLPPARHGFGSMILTRVLTQQIGAKVDASYSPDGFELRADIPLVIERA